MCDAKHGSHYVWSLQPFCIIIWESPIKSTPPIRHPEIAEQVSVLAIDDRHVTFCEYNGSVARIICVAVATLANEKLLERASDNDLLLWRKSTSNKMRYRQWFDRCIISKMILKSGLSWLFPVVFSFEITLAGSHSGNSFEFSVPNYALFCLSCLRLNLKPVNYLTMRRSSAKDLFYPFLAQQKITKSYEYWMFCLSNVQSLLFIMIIYELLLLVN